MQLNKGLNLDGLPDTVETGDLRYAENVVLDNTFKLPTNENGLSAFLKGGEFEFENIAGIIPYDKGIIIFCKVANDNYIINFNTNTEDIVIKLNFGTKLIFNKDYPIRGTYNYNQNGNLIILFSCGVNGLWEDKILDIDIFKSYIVSSIKHSIYNINTKTYIITDSDLYLMDINPNITFPKISHGINVNNTSTDIGNNILVSGNLNTGSYQIAISYKIDNEYTNHSLLSLPVYIYGTKGTDYRNEGDITMGLPPNVNSGYGIKYKLLGLDLNYDFYKIAIIFNDGITYTIYNTNDISTSTTIFDLKNTTNYNLSTLDETLINSIYYSNSEAIAIMNNIAYRSNLKINTNSEFDSIAKTLANNVILKLVSSQIDTTKVSKTGSHSLKDKQFIKFQNDEVYALNLTLGDKKGNIIGSYPIDSKFSNYPYLTNVDEFEELAIINEEIITTNSVVVEVTKIINTITINKVISPIEGIIHSIEPYVNTISCTAENNTNEITISSGAVYDHPIDITIQFEYAYVDNTYHMYSIVVTLPANETSKVVTIHPPGYHHNGNVESQDINTINSTLLKVLTAETYTNDVIIQFNYTINYATTSIDKTANVKVLKGKNFSYLAIEDSISIYTVTLPSINEFTISTSNNLILDTSFTFKIYKNENVVSIPITILHNSSTVEYTYHDLSTNAEVILNSGGIDIMTYKLSVPLNVAQDINIVKRFYDYYTQYTNTFKIPSGSNISANYTFQINYATFGIENISQDRSTDLTTIKVNVNPNKPIYIPMDINFYIGAEIDNTDGDTEFILKNNIAISLKFNDFEKISAPYNNYLYSNNDLIKTIKVTPNPLVYRFPISYKNYYTICKEQVIYNAVNNTPVKYYTNSIEVTLPDLSSYSNEFKDKIGFWCIHRAERNNNNSKIYTQGVAITNPIQIKTTEGLYYVNPININTSGSNDASKNVFYKYNSGNNQWLDNFGMFELFYGVYINIDTLDGHSTNNASYNHNSYSGSIICRMYYINSFGVQVNITRTDNVIINGIEVEGFTADDGKKFALWHYWTDTWFDSFEHMQLREYNPAGVSGYNFKIGTEYSVRLYSFEDLFNQNNYFPAINDIAAKPNIEIISLVDYTAETFNDTDGLNNNYNVYTDNKELLKLDTSICKNKYNKIISQKLLDSNNISANNFYKESTRKLVLADNNSGFFCGNTNAPNMKASNAYYRVNIFNGTETFYIDRYNETFVLCSNINKLSDNKIIANGDTFYSEMYIRSKGLYTTYNVVAPLITNAEINNIENERPSGISDLTYHYTFLIESKYNIHARYWKGDYPKYDNPINTSTQKGYDKVYHLENKQNAIICLDPNIIVPKNNLFPNRIIKSIKYNNESNSIGFKKYLALDYFDMPINRGAIKSLYNTYKNMYIQQELSLSIASIKDVISYQDGATYVGTGELFDRQPQEVIPTGYGYIGCESYYNTGICDLGYWIIDSLQSQIFLISDNNAIILTNGKCERWFKDKLHGVNPFKNQGSFITYDKQLKRFLLTVTNDDASKAFTISYVPEIKNWFSFHFYTPMYGLYTRNDTYFLIDSDVSNDNPTYRFFKFVDTIKSKLESGNIETSIRRNDTEIHKMIISIYHNDYYSINKLYEALSWDTSFVINAVDIFDKTFTELNLTNDSQSTGMIALNNNQEWFDSDTGVHKNNVWWFNKIFDYIKDNKKNIFNPSPTNIYDAFDINNNNINNTLEWFEISRFISTFVAVTFIFDNLYYSIDGNFKGNTRFATIIDDVYTPITFQPTISLKDIDFEYKRNTR